jgi:histidinol-phosphatase (PHP family)
MLTNLHTHCTFCDGDDSAADMAEAAFLAGFHIMGFSSHAPLPYKNSWTINPDQLHDYTATIRALQQAYHGRMELLLGLEIDHIAGTCGPADGRFKDLGLDYTIGSVHHVQPPNVQPPEHIDQSVMTIDGPQDDFDRLINQGYAGDTGLLVEDYYKAVGECIAAGGFDILGHLDLIRKNNPAMSRFREDTPHYRSAVMPVVDALRGSGIIVEINTGGMARGKTSDPYPSLWILRELRARHVEICINADAHRREHLSMHRDAALQAAASAGYERMVIISRTGRSWVPLA